MKLKIGSYNKNIYELDIINDNFSNLKVISEVSKPSFLINDNPLSFIYQEGNVGFVSINGESVKVTHTSCHISFNKKNNSYYISHYQDGSLSIINNKSFINNNIKFKNNSHIHYSEYIETIDLIGITDLGDNIFYLYDNNNNYHTSFKFDDNYGPRHFSFHKSLPIIYIITEHIPAIFVLKYENNELILLEKHLIGTGHGSAIRIDTNNNYLYAAVRTSDYIFVFKINENGLLEIKQKTHTYGSHPRDFNLSSCNNYLVVANMHSDNLALFKITNGKLYLLQKDFYLEQGASVIF